jgi:hypothetical protein
MIDWQRLSNPIGRGAYRVDTRRFRHRNVSFDPTGALYVVGDVNARGQNPIAERYPEQIAARLFVGLKVGNVERWSLDDVLSVTRETRVAQVGDGDPGASFLYQKGIYRETSGAIIDENSVQVIVLNLTGATQEEFEAQMVEVAETLARRLEQEQVWVELQRNGVHVATLKVVP